MKKNFTCLSVCLAILSLYGSLHAQYYNQSRKFLKANSVWVMGVGGCDFNSGHPVPFMTEYVDSLINLDYKIPYSAYEAFASVADPETGQLQFFVNRHGFFDRTYALMPGNSYNAPWYYDVWSNAQPYCIVPFIGDNKRFYVFRRHTSLYSTNDTLAALSYSVVDMNLRDGKGDIEPATNNKPLFLFSNNDTLGLGMIAVPGNNCDVWLIVRLLTRTVYYAYHITAAGIDPQPVISNIDEPGHYFTRGGITISPDRKTLASVYESDDDPLGQHSVRLAHFDPETGIASSGIGIGKFGLGKVAHVVAFSPDGKKLYASSSQNTMVAYRQYDLSQYDPTTISASERTLGNYSSLLTQWGTPVYLKLYGDSIYFNTYVDSNIFLRSDGSYGGYLNMNAGLGIIRQANQGGSNNPFSTPVILPRGCSYSLPNDVVYAYLSTDTIPDLYADISVCANNGVISQTSLTAKPGFNNYVWNDGTVGLAKSVDKEGKYWVYYKGSCNSRVDTFVVHKKPPLEWLSADTVVCEQRLPFTLTAYSGADAYQWNESGADEDHITVYQTGKFWVTGFKEGCRQTDTISVSTKSCSCQIELPNAFSPNGDGLNDYFKPSMTLGCVPSAYSMRIFNRWGQVVYSSFNEFDQGWNGMEEGRLANPGIYFYEVRFKTRFMEEGSYYHKGELVLVR